jgi:AcrR family transcriptional regulator
MPDDLRKPTSRYHHGNLRSALLAAALEIVEERGVGALTLRSVAQRLGVSHAAPVYHFPTKAHLLSALAESGFDELAGLMERAAEGPASGRLARAGRAYWDFARGHPGAYQIMFGPELARERAESPGLEMAASRTLRALMACVDEKPNPVPLGPKALYAWSLVHGLVSLRAGPLLCRMPPEGQATIDSWLGGFLEWLGSSLGQGQEPSQGRGGDR